MSSILAVLNARRSVLRQPTRPRISASIDATPQDDPFTFESHGFYTTTQINQTGPSLRRSRVRPPIRTIRKSKPSRFVAKWTPQLDKLLRKSLRRFGWGSWTRMEQSGIFPANYSRTILARRIKALGYTKEMVKAEREAHRKKLA